MKNKKKGFTLIELLAIIVILAIIAVITVPIILNIIENSKKGAATDSAFGYKDAIDKYFVTKLSANSAYNMPNGTYTVDGTTGYLSLNESNPQVILEVEVDGQKPSGGYVILEANIVKQACVTFGDYSVTYVDGYVRDTVKGDCSGVTVIPSTPSVVHHIDTDGDGEVDTGEDVIIGDEENGEPFKVINPNKDGNVVALAQYNLKEQPSNVGFVQPSSNGMLLMINNNLLATNDTTVWRQYSGADYTTVKYAGGCYWQGAEGCEITPSATGFECVGGNYSKFGWLQDYNSDYSDTKYIYRTSDGSDTLNNIYPILNAYKDYLRSLGANISDVRLMSWSEAPGDKLTNGQNYFLGTSSGFGCTVREIYEYQGTQNYAHVEVSSDFTYKSGIRPVIEIPVSQFQ